MADKSSQLVLNALSRAAAEPNGLPLHSGKTLPGLFPATPLGKQAATHGVQEGLLRLKEAATVRDSKTKLPPEIYVMTEKGMTFLLEQANPRQVLEDLVRALEARQAQTGELLQLASQMRADLVHLKAATERILHLVPRTEALTAALQNTPMPDGERTAHERPSQRRFDENGHGRPASTAESVAALNRAILADLARWHGSGASEDYPLAELFRHLQAGIPGLTIGRFHDALRDLHDADRIYLHPWTGPLYDLPEPAFALLVGHLVAYYASARQCAETAAEELGANHLLRFPAR